MEWIRRVEVTRFKVQGTRHTLSAEARLYDVSRAGLRRQKSQERFKGLQVAGHLGTLNALPTH